MVAEKFVLGFIEKGNSTRHINAVAATALVQIIECFQHLNGISCKTIKGCDKNHIFMVSTITSGFLNRGARILHLHHRRAIEPD
jgi:hypothetical protein